MTGVVPIRAQRNYTINNMPDSQYFALTDYLSQSLLCHAVQSPRHFLHAMENPLEGYFLDVGSVHHAENLQPGQVPYIVSKWKTTTGKGFKEEYDSLKAEDPHRPVICQNDKDKIDRIRQEMARSCPQVLEMIADADAIEQVAIWEDEETGIKCKAKADFVYDGDLYDLKTTSEKLTDIMATEESRRAYLSKFDYYFQAAHYITGFRKCGVKARDFFFVISEKQPPYATAILGVDPSRLVIAKRRHRQALDNYAKYCARGRYPSFPEVLRG